MDLWLASIDAFVSLDLGDTYLVGGGAGGGAVTSALIQRGQEGQNCPSH